MATPTTYYPNAQAFKAEYAKGRSQIVYTKLIADTETPVSVFLKLRGDARPSILLESVEGGEVLGRYSAIGLDPDLIWTCRDGVATLTHPSNPDKNATAAQDALPKAPLAYLKTLIADSRIDCVPEELPPMASSGLFGYMGYDMIRLVEDIPCKNPDPLAMPDSIMMRPRLMVVFDNIRHVVYLATPVRLHAQNDGSEDDVDRIYAQAVAYIDSAKQALLETSIADLPVIPASRLDPDTLAARSNFTRDTYRRRR